MGTRDEVAREEAVDQVIGDLDVEEVACEDMTVEGLEGGTIDESEGVDEIVELTPEEERDIDEWIDRDEPLGAAAPGLGPSGGGWGGSARPAKRVIRLAKRAGLTITSKKRSILSSGSDHHISQKRAFAVDASNASSPTPEMDRFCRQIARRLGHPEFRGGVLTVPTGHGYRVQLLYRTNVGGNHFNHVHVGIRMN